MRHNPSDREADLSLNQLQAYHGEEFLLTYIEEYSQDKFAFDYNQMRPKGLENTEMLWKDGLKLRVDKMELGLNVRRMKPFEGKLTLDVDFEGTGLATFRKDVKGFSIRAKNHRLVRSMMVDGKDVLMTYGEADGSIHVTTVSVPRLAEGVNSVKFCDYWGRLKTQRI